MPDLPGLFIVLLGFFCIGALLTLIHLCVSASYEEEDDGEGN
jgi:hypothetical protein